MLIFANDLKAMAVESDGNAINMEVSAHKPKHLWGSVEENDHQTTNYFRLHPLRINNAQQSFQAIKYFCSAMCPLHLIQKVP